MKTFSHSGHIGDIIYSLPCIKILSSGEGAVLHIKEVFEDHRGHINGNCGPEDTNYTQFMALEKLLLQQPYITEVRKYVPPPGYDYSPMVWPGLKMDYDLDRSRMQRGRKYIFHVKRYFDTFGIMDDWTNHVPWLELDAFRVDMNLAIFHVTDRWHGFTPDWTKLMAEAREKYGKIIFTGYKHDHEKFVNRYGDIDYVFTENLLELARFISYSKALYCNQNCALVIAQGLGKKYYLARNVDRTHCHTFLNNETLI